MSTVTRAARIKALMAIGLIAGLGVRLIAISHSPLHYQPTRQFFSALIARAIYFDHFSSASASSRAIAGLARPGGIDHRWRRRLQL
jgi:hypothetical protein